ncbi:hypothetical protein MMC26_005119 [Xylographa opegraphella]|nr:hypothetical protein [Xylographa opegraphella]
MLRVHAPQPHRPRRPADAPAPATPPPPQRILADPVTFPPLPAFRAPLRVAFSCAHTAPPSVLPMLYTTSHSSTPSTTTDNPFGAPNPPHALPYPCRECALTLTHSAFNYVHRMRDLAIAALETQIADARREIWVGGGRVVGLDDPLLVAYERAHEQLRVLLGERAHALWEVRGAWERVWGEWVEGEEGGG